MKLEHEWIHDLHRLSVMYNQLKSNSDIKVDEVYKFVEWVYKQYGYFYRKPDLTNQ